MRRLFLVAALALAGCPKRDAAPTSPPPPPSAGPRGPDGGAHHTERFASAAWRPDGAFRTCGERGGRPAGCKAVARPGEPAADSPSEGDVRYLPDRAPFDAAPGGCRVLFDDATGDPGAPAARATLKGPAAATPIDAWKAPPNVDGDYFAVETSFSPDGKWLAVIHTAVGLGADERLVEVKDVEVRPAPPCR